MKWLPWILVLLFAGVVLYLWNHSVSQPSDGIVRDTVEFVDTIPYYHPVLKDSVVIRYETVKLPIKKDTCGSLIDTCITFPDSVEVEIPITQKEYKDSFYRAWISGYNAKLDSIEIYNRTKVITEHIYIQSKRKRWGLGLQAGYGYLTGAYIGIGVSYSLFQW